MDVDQPVITAFPTAPAHVSGTGIEPDPGTTESTSVPVSSATAAITPLPDHNASSNKEKVQYPSSNDAGSGPGSGPSSVPTINQAGGENFNNPDWKAKLEKFIQQKKLKIPDPPKTTAEKIPSGVKEPSTKKTIDSIPAETDAVPSKTYNSILSSKRLKGKVGTIGGTTSGQGSSECGSFFNKGDNRILRSVYRED
jgi:hypothetical protein